MNHATPRVAREQIVIFTPLGFMPQHKNEREPDARGLSGRDIQRHLSGWMPGDFGSNWTFYICEDFHRSNFRSEKLEQPHGAFFAIKKIDAVEINIPSAWSDLRRAFPSELKAMALEEENRALREKLEKQSARNPLAGFRWR